VNTFDLDLSVRVRAHFTRLCLTSLISGLLSAGLAHASSEKPAGAIDSVNPATGQAIWLLPDGTWKPANNTASVATNSSAGQVVPVQSTSARPPQVYPNSSTNITVNRAAEGSVAGVTKVSIPQAAQTSGQVETVQSSSQGAPQGRLFGVGREILPSDKDYNRGSMNPKLK
jgi:hypothetical protein